MIYKKLTLLIVEKIKGIKKGLLNLGWIEQKNS